MRAPDTYQQGIADQIAQPLQRVAGGRLRQPDPHRRAADAGFPQQRVERDQEIEIERIQIHQVNIYHIHYRLEECHAARDDRHGQSNGEAAMSAADNKKLVQQIYADAASRSGTTFADNLADDACWIVTGQYSWSHEFRGREAILNGLMGHFRSFFAVRPRTVALQFHRRRRLCRGRGAGRQRDQGRPALRQSVLHGVPDRERQDQGDQGILRLHAGRTRARAVSGSTASRPQAKAIKRRLRG